MACVFFFRTQSSGLPIGSWSKFYVRRVFVRRIVFFMGFLSYTVYDIWKNLAFMSKPLLHFLPAQISRFRSQFFV